MASIQERRTTPPVSREADEPYEGRPEGAAFVILRTQSAARPPLRRSALARPPCVRRLCPLAPRPPPGPGTAGGTGGSMASRAAAVRNVALAGHGDSGKTTFMEAALHKAGAIQRRGSIAEKNTVGDYEAEAKDTGHSTDVSCTHLKWKDREIQFVDCPGYPDFAGVATSGLWSCDTVALFVNAAGGVSVNTRKMWTTAGELGRARVVVISKMDHENADPERALAQVKESLGDRCRPFNLPVGKGTGFKGVANCFGKAGAAAGPTLCGDLDSARSAFLEAVVEVDDGLLERYLGGETIADE